MLRVPAVAGSFYPADPAQLQHTIAEFLLAVPAADKVPKAMIVPHAGHIYSGPIAASAYARLKPAAQRIKRVVLIGPSHHFGFKGMSVCTADAYTTPLGEIPLDKAATEQILQLPFVSYIDDAHVPEHCLEVHLPFLQSVLGDFTLVPIIAGDATPDEVAIVLDNLWGNEETLLVISSDLSHYYDYEAARYMDTFTSQLIEHLDYKNIPNLAACGKVPVTGLLRLLEHKGLSIKTIDLRNSGDTAGDKQRVVGYGAYVVD